MMTCAALSELSPSSPKPPFSIWQAESAPSASSIASLTVRSTVVPVALSVTVKTWVLF